MLLRGMSQIQDLTINRPKLQLDFLDGTNWDITNGNNDATITGLAAGVNANDAVNFQQLTDLFEGIKKRFVARVKAQTNVIALTGTQTIDGVALVDGDTILLDQQTTTTQDGLWIVRAGAWERHPFWDVGEDVGAYFLFVKEGTDDNKGFVCTNNTGSDIIGTDDLVFIQSSGAGTISADNGITMTGSNIQLGGPLTQNTSITTNTNSLTFTGIGVGGTFNVHMNDAVNLWGNQAELRLNNDLDLDANLALRFDDSEVKASGILNAIPFAMTATTDYGNGNGTNAGDVIDQFRTEFTDDAIVNALVELKAMIDGSTVTASNGLTMVANDVQWGGTLTAPMSMDLDGNNMSFVGSGSENVSFGSSSTELNQFNVRADDNMTLWGNQASLVFDQSLSLDALTSIQFDDSEVKSATVTTDIPFSMTATADYGNGNGTASGDVINQFRAEFTDDAIVNALVELKALVDNPVVSTEESITVANGTSVTLTGGNTTSVVKDVFLNGNRLVPGDEFTLGDDGSHRVITEVVANQDFTNGDVVTVIYMV